jgi:hypothetical protein
LNQIRGNSYCHIFGFVEEYIVPMVMANAGRDIYGDETRLWSLLRFAEEELKHQELMRRACDQFESGYGVQCGLIPGREAVAEVVLGKSPLAALLLTSMIEWFTQLHYVEHVRDSEELDGLFRDILRFHWIDESRHARLDTLLIDEVAADLTPEQRERAVDELLELGGAVDGLLAQQLELDIEALALSAQRSFSDAEKSEIRREQQRGLPLDVPGLWPGTPEVRPDRARAHRGGPRQDRGRRPGAVVVTTMIVGLACRAAPCPRE